MTREKLLSWIDILARIYAIFRPKYHNYLAWIVVVGGLALLSGPWWEPYLRSILGKYLSIDVPAPPPAWLGVILVALGLVYHFFAFRLERVRWVFDRENIREHDAKIREHDAVIFGSFKQLLSDDTFYGIISELVNDHSYLSSDGHVLDNASRFLRTPQSSFLDSELIESAQGLLRPLYDLRDFTVHRFFVSPRDQTTRPFRLCMQPSHNIDRGGSGSDEEMRLYAGWTSELDTHCKETSEAYRSFVQTAHRRLGRQALD